MLSHEIRLEMNKGKTQFDIMHDMSANFAQKAQNHNKPNNVNTGYDNGGYGSVSPFGDKNVVCQICFIPGHVAYKCRNRFNYDFVPRQGRGNIGGFRPRGGQQS